MRLITFVVVALCVSAVPVLAQGMICSTESIRGNWGVVCSGSITPAPGAPLTQMTALGTAKIDAAGYTTSEATLSVGGGIVTQNVTGQAVVKDDCTGTIKYSVKINGQPAPDINIRFFILDSGKQMRGISVDPGSILACQLHRIGM